MKNCMNIQFLRPSTALCCNSVFTFDPASMTALPASLARIRLAAFDMDSTLINIECVDEIADAAGRKAEVAAITEAAMRGEIADYKDSLRRRVALLRGVSVGALREVLRTRLQFNPGARQLTAALKANDCRLLLVSGGFTYFTDHVKAELGMDFVRSNVLGIDAATQTLDGTLVDQPWGDICDGAEKRRTLLEVASLLGIPLSQCMAVGDGANDLPMMLACSEAGGLSVAYHAKPKVQEQALICINEGGLDSLLTR
jgi:phosphoserine phosphatase